MVAFHTKQLSDLPDVIAPDGSHVRVLLALKGGSVAHFELAEGNISSAIMHRSVDEIWYVLQGLGVMWRKSDEQEETVRLEPGVCLTIPCGTRFQFRSIGPGPLRAVAITMPPWPGADEAVFVEGLWKPKG